jgi:hypothetical protein
MCIGPSKSYCPRINLKFPDPFSTSFQCVKVPFNFTQARAKHDVRYNSANVANSLSAVIIKNIPWP